MERLLPWQRLEKKINRFYPKSGNDRRPYPLYAAMEDALYEIESMHRFAGLSITENLPDESTILKFRHLLEAHKLGENS